MKWINSLRIMEDQFLTSENQISEYGKEMMLESNWKHQCEIWPTTVSAKSLQSCPTLWDPIDGSPPGSPIPGILQARTLEWVAISFSNAWKWKVKVKSLSCVQLLATPWTAAYQAPPSMGFSRQEYWSGLPLPSPDLRARNSVFQTCSSNYLHTYHHPLEGPRYIM